MHLRRLVPIATPLVAAVLASSLLAPASADPRSGAEGTRAVVRDARGDARGDSPRVRWLADLRRVSYRTPSTQGGTMTVGARWAEHRAPRHPSQQRLVVLVDGRSSDPDQGFALATPRRPVTIYYFAEGDVEPRLVRPDEVDLERTFGPGGRTRVTVSTEWLDADRAEVSVGSFVDVRRSSGVDFVRGALLRVGPRR